MPPIAHQVHHDSEHALKHNPGVLHAAIRVICKPSSKCAAGLGVGEDGVAFRAQGECQELGAWYFISREWSMKYAPCMERKYEQTSVVIPASITWLLPVAATAARNSELSQASTSPLRRMRGASGYMPEISFGKRPFGPCSALVVKTIGRLKAFAIAAWAIILLRKTVGS